jgi:GT2 family glycosyltransferase
VADIYIRFQENKGFAPAVNAGLRVAQGKYRVACNNDVEFLDDWVGGAIAAWDSETGVISSHLHDHDPEHKAGRMVALWGHFFGALWMVSQEVLSKVGELDAGYERGMFEDRDFVRRVIGVGYQHVKVGWCRHAGNATWGKLPNQSEIYLKNKQRFEAKWT